ncbi:MAG: SDR family oxidoreductase [Burkholderiales bacterium]|nr:SDR family oxidoreductase [Burkholderiales bacterium]
MRLAGKTAVITGAAAGIGRAVAALFVREGARVIVADQNGDAARATAAALGASASAFACDVADAAQCEALMREAEARFGRLDILVNNAGFGALGSVVTTAEAVLDRILAVNVKGVFLCSKFAVPLMERGGGGVIVNTASNTATIGLKDRAAYVASKGAVAALTRAMALDHAGANIRVNCVAPGVTMTSYFDRMLAEVPDPAAFRRVLDARQPLGRTAQPEEIAYAFLYLASDESAFATGSMLTVDGGASSTQGTYAALQPAAPD